MSDGRERDFGLFLAANGKSLMRLAVLLCRDADAAEDLLQDVLEVAYLKWSRIMAADDPAAYVRQMLVNKSIDRARRRRFLTVPLLGHHDAAVSAERSEDTDVLLAALRRLPPRQRAVVVLRFCEDLSEAQTARVLDCSVGTVKSSSSKALQRLRAELGDVFVTEGKC